MSITPTAITNQCAGPCSESSLAAHVLCPRWLCLTLAVSYPQAICRGEVFITISSPCQCLTERDYAEHRSIWCQAILKPGIKTNPGGTIRRRPRISCGIQVRFVYTASWCIVKYLGCSVGRWRNETSTVAEGVEKNKYGYQNAASGYSLQSLRSTNMLSLLRGDILLAHLLLFLLSSPHRVVGLPRELDHPRYGLLFCLHSWGKKSLNSVRRRGCATHVTREQAFAAEAHFAKHRVARDDVAPRGTVNVPVVFHVIQKDDSLEGGNVPYVEQSVRHPSLVLIALIRDSQLEEQIDVLRQDYNGTGLSFYLANTTRTTDVDWFNISPSDEIGTLSMKASLRQGGRETLNVWLLGYVARHIYNFRIPEAPTTAQVGIFRFLRAFDPPSPVRRISGERRRLDTFYYPSWRL